MKRYTLIALAFLFFGACTQFDDTKIWDKLNDHENRISSLEATCNRLNENITSIQAILEAVQKGLYVTDVKAVRRRVKSDIEGHGFACKALGNLFLIGTLGNHASGLKFFKQIHNHSSRQRRAPFKL